jgi:hypothetical protein
MKIAVGRRCKQFLQVAISQIVRLQLEGGADINAKPAERYGEQRCRQLQGEVIWKIIQLLLGRNADINFGSAEDNARTALQSASKTGQCWTRKTRREDGAASGFS